MESVTLYFLDISQKYVFFEICTDKFLLCYHCIRFQKIMQAFLLSFFNFEMNFVIMLIVVCYLTDEFARK